jgi:hypothetical protein
MSTEKTLLENENQPSCLAAVIGSTFHDGLNQAIEKIENILDYKSNTKWGSALRHAVSQISELKQKNNGWIKLEGVAGEMLDCDCWVLDGSGNIFFSEQGQYIPIGLYKYYMPILKPNVLPDGY